MAKEAKPIYKRIILKMSGEVLMGDGLTTIDPRILDRLVVDLTAVHDMGVQIGIVIGGGNIFRGKTLQKIGINRITGDHMGMLATMINALALRDAIERASLPVRILSALPMSGIADHFNQRNAIDHLQQGRIVIFAGGTGNPLVTTDSAASLRGIEVAADVLLKATNVDGVYSDDPSVNKDAQLYKTLSFQEALEKELAIMDLTAFTQCRDHSLPIRVFNINKPHVLLHVLESHDEGTTVQ